MARNKRTLTKELNELRSKGLILPKNASRAAQTAREMGRMVTNPGELQSDVRSLFRRTGNLLEGPSSAEHVKQLQSNSALISAMRRNRGMRRVGSSSDISIAIPRFYDPLEYWDLSGLPWNMADEGHRHKLHKWLRLFYATHYLVPSLVDIFTRFPLAGLSCYCKDKSITEFYEDVFLDRLRYEEFLVGLGREYWTVGEAFPLGSFNEDLGIWEREELLNPEDIVIENFPLLGTSQMKVVPPEYLKRLADTKSPPKEYKQLEENFPELIPYLRRGEPFPVADVLLKQVAFRITDWDDHGTPILLRALRTLLHEEKLLASQDAIAERLYSPMILAKLGINEMGNDMGPWIPDESQLDDFRDDMDVALSSDFRLLVYHYALEVENVFGREQVPNLWEDFLQIERRLFQAFGINPGLLSGGENGQPYASSALQAEFMNQMLSTYQGYLKEHWRQRALIVAEAQGHYDYEKRGDTRVPIMEEVVVVDEETGQLRIEERHKLLVPELEMEVLDMRDEATERQFLQSLRAMGVPISDERLMVGISFEFKDSLDEMQEEMIQKTVAQQMAKLQTYKILKEQGLPIPPDLKAEVEATNAPPGGPGGGAPGSVGDMGTPGAATVGAPPMGGPGGSTMVMPPVPPGLGPNGIGGAVPGGGPPAASPFPPGPPGSVPPVSNERRPGMPTASKVLQNPDNTELSYDEIESRMASCEAYIAQLEEKKKMRRFAKEQVRSARFDPEVEWDRRKESRIVIDKVPPRVRKKLADGD